VAAIHLGFQKTLYMGNIDSLRDWGDARDYVKGMYLILQQDKPDDYVLATGEMHSVREFIERAFAEVGRSIAWRGKGVDEEGVDAKTGDVLVKIDPRYFRPTEVELLLGDPSKARKVLGWKHEITFPQLVKEMVASDLKKIGEEGQRNS
jgi:GDPmannose 4,6-dehydratase